MELPDIARQLLAIGAIFPLLAGSQQGMSWNGFYKLSLVVSFKGFIPKTWTRSFVIPYGEPASLPAPFRLEPPGVVWIRGLGI